MRESFRSHLPSPALNLCSLRIFAFSGSTNWARLAAARQEARTCKGFLLICFHTFSGVTFWAIFSKYLWGKLFIQIFPMSQPPPCLDATYKLKHDDGCEMHSSDTSSWSQLRCGQCTTGERAGGRNLYSTQVQHQPPNLQLSIQKAAHHLTNPLMYECKYK